MANWEPSAGATLHLPSGPVKHLFVVLNDPKIFKNYGNAVCIVLVNLSSVPAVGMFDNTCVLKAGSHPSIIRDSYVFYRHARIEQVRDVIQRIEAGVYSPSEAMPEQLLQQIKAGLLQSPFTKREFKQLGI
jgi:hypothetical protein